LFHAFILLHYKKSLFLIAHRTIIAKSWLNDLLVMHEITRLDPGVLEKIKGNFI